MNSYIANVLYLESPAGVGYSYTVGEGQPTNDTDTAKQNLAALKSFSLKFPEYANNEFFLTGESYGAVYIPTLSVLLLEDGTFNFKGFAIGNDLHSWDLDDRTSLINAGYHGLYSSETLQKLLKFCCNNSILTCDFYSTEDTCLEARNEAYNSLHNADFNPYYIYDTCDSYLTNFIASKLHFRYRNSIHKPKWTSRRTSLMTRDPDCTSDESLQKWMNIDEVRTALHIPSNLPKWGVCGGQPYYITYTEMAPFYKVLLPSVRALIYNGDADTVCSNLLGEYFVQSLGIPEVRQYQAWNLDKTTVGFTVQYENLIFVTIMNAGHMVPSNKPIPALEMLRNFITNTPF